MADINFLNPVLDGTTSRIRLKCGLGILFATVITLVLVPSLYMIVNDIRSRIHKTT
jgi:hypothetical protein